MPGHIFISYASKDEKRVEQICRLLEQRGIRCWIARRDARPGYNYGAEIIEAIDSAAALLVILSQHCNQSEHVPREVERTVHSHKPVLPVRIEPVEPSRELEYYISIKHRIDVSAPPTDAEIKRLVEAIHGHLECSGEPATDKTDEQRTRLAVPRSTRPYRRYSLVAASVAAEVHARGKAQREPAGHRELRPRAHRGAGHRGNLALENVD